MDHARSVVSGFSRTFFVVSTVVGFAFALRTGSYLLTMPEELDFSQFYLSALVAKTSPGTSIYDTATVDRLAAEHGIHNYEVANYPPIVALLFAPLTWFSYRTATAIWFSLNLVTTAAPIGLAWLVIPPSRRRTVWFAAWFVLLMPATAESLILGQINGILGVLLALAVYGGLRRERAWRVAAGAALGLAGAVKVWPMALGGYFLLRKRFAFVGWSVAVFVLLTALSASVLGAGMVRHFFTDRLPQSAVSYAQASNARNQSIWGVSEHFFQGGVTQVARLSNANVRNARIRPLVESDTLYVATAIIFTVCLGAFTLWRIVRIPSGDVTRETQGGWIALISLLAVLPFSWTHYAYFLVFVLVARLADERENVSRTIALGVACLSLMLVHRAMAWLPPSPFLLGFVFLAYLTMIAGTVRQA